MLMLGGFLLVSLLLQALCLWGLFCINVKGENDMMFHTGELHALHEAGVIKAVQAAVPSATMLTIIAVIIQHLPEILVMFSDVQKMIAAIVGWLAPAPPPPA